MICFLHLGNTSFLDLVSQTYIKIVFPHINISKSEMKDCSCEINDQKHAGGGGDLASSEEGRVQHQSHQSELVKQQQSGGEMERLVSDINSLYLGGIVNYLRLGPKLNLVAIMVLTPPQSSQLGTAASYTTHVKREAVEQVGR